MCCTGDAYFSGNMWWNLLSFIPENKMDFVPYEKIWCREKSRNLQFSDTERGHAVICGVCKCVKGLTLPEVSMNFVVGWTMRSGMQNSKVDRFRCGKYFCKIFSLNKKEMSWITQFSYKVKREMGREAVVVHQLITSKEHIDTDTEALSSYIPDLCFKLIAYDAVQRRIFLRLIHVIGYTGRVWLVAREKGLHTFTDCKVQDPCIHLTNEAHIQAGFIAFDKIENISLL